VKRGLNKLLIEQTKSRSGRTNDNALVEGKNGSVIRKHMGHWYIEQKYAPLINRFYMEHFNTYLNFHRPSGFATVTVDAKGKRSKKYKTYQTPHERLKLVVNAARSKPAEPEKYLREGVSLEVLDGIAAKQTDNESARMMQEAKDRLFKKLGAERDMMPIAIEFPSSSSASPQGRRNELPPHGGQLGPLGGTIGFPKARPAPWGPAVARPILRIGRAQNVEQQRLRQRQTSNDNGCPTASPSHQRHL